MTNLVPSRPPQERETGFEPATPSLEGWRSTAELFPPVLPMRSISRVEWRQVVGRGGFEPPKAFASRFTVCPLWPLGYLPASPDRNALIAWLMVWLLSWVSSRWPARPAGGTGAGGGGWRPRAQRRRWA